MTSTQPSPLELQVLSVLWERGESTVREVLETLPDGKDRAYTTALSVLQTMERKGLVSRKTGTKAHIYKPKKTEKQILVPKIKEEISNVYSGSALKFISYALEAVTLTEDEKTELTKILKEQKTKANPKKAAKKKVAAASAPEPAAEAPAPKKKAAAKKKAAKKKTAKRK